MGEPPLLEIESLEVGYGRAAPVIRDVSLTLGAGEQVVVLGANGAGKSTLLLAIAGVLRARSGTIRVRGEDVTDASVHDRVALGLSLALEGHRVVSELSVIDNLRLAVAAGAPSRSRREARTRVESSLERFEVLSRNRHRLAGTLSGGEQQMLVMARLLAIEASVLLVDEPSLGLSPLMTRRVYEMLGQASAAGCGTLIVEQSATDVLRGAQRAFVLRDSGLDPFDAGASRAELARAYLGVSG
jgi:branched-chain amino acid transport system ATP-binding protein